MTHDGSALCTPPTRMSTDFDDDDDRHGLPMEWADHWNTAGTRKHTGTQEHGRSTGTDDWSSTDEDSTVA
jgi:hypothetical protein